MEIRKYFPKVFCGAFFQKSDSSLQVATDAKPSAKPSSLKLCRGAKEGDERSEVSPTRVQPTGVELILNQSTIIPTKKPRTITPTEIQITRFESAHHRGLK